MNNQDFEKSDIYFDDERIKAEKFGDIYKEVSKPKPFNPKFNLLRSQVFRTQNINKIINPGLNEFSYQTARKLLILIKFYQKLNSSSGFLVDNLPKKNFEINKSLEAIYKVLFIKVGFMLQLCEEGKFGDALELLNEVFDNFSKFFEES